MNKRKQSTRLLSILLALMLCLGLLPTVAFAQSGGTTTQQTVDESVDTSTTQVLGVLQTSREIYENTAAINNDPDWITGDEGETYEKIIYDSGKIDVNYDDPCPSTIQTLIDAAETTVDASGKEYAAQPNLSYADTDTSYTDKVTDNRKYQWFFGGEGPYPDLVDSTTRYMLISQDYGRARIYIVVGIIGSSIEPQEIDYTLTLSNGKGYKNNTSGDEVNLADFNISSDVAGNEYIYIFNSVNLITTAPIAVSIEDKSATIDLANSSQNVIISGSDTAASTCGIRADGDLCFVGDGSLMAFAGESEYESAGIRTEGTLTVCSGSIEGNCGATSNGRCYGIFARSGITVDGGNVVGNAIDAKYYSYGIYSLGDFIANSGCVTGNGGNAQEQSYGIYADTDFIVNDGSVEAKADEVAKESYGITVQGDYTIIGGEVTLSGNTMASAKWDKNSKAFIPNAPKTQDENSINLMHVMAGQNADGSGMADVIDWVGDGSDDVGKYKNMYFEPGSEADECAHKLDKIDAVAPDCKNVGNNEYFRCSECGKYFKDPAAVVPTTPDEEVIAKLSHTYKWETVTEATKDNEGLAEEVCSVCGNKSGNTKVLDKLPADLMEYQIIEGANQTVEQGKEAAFRSEADFVKFLKVTVDGADVDAANYTVVEGSTIVTLKAEYTKELSVGTHTLTVVSNDGTASTSFTVKTSSNATDNTDNTGKTDNDITSPQTGDNSNMLLWVMLLFISGAGITMTTIYSRKKRTTR